MTDNGSAYRSHAFRLACATASLRHLRTRPYTSRTNGKAERFLQTVMLEMRLCPCLPILTGTDYGATPLAPPLQRAPAA